MPAPLFSFLHLIIDSEPRPAPMNMAIDEMLLQQAAEPTLRIYRWLSPRFRSAVLKNSRRSRAIRRPGVREAVHRGGVVPHGRDVTYSIIVPRRFDFSRRDASQVYRVIHERIAVVLRGEGIEACVTSARAENFQRLFRARESARPHARRKKLRAQHSAVRATACCIRQHQNLELSARFPGQMAQAFSACFESRVLQRATRCGERAAGCQIRQRGVAQKY